MRLLRAAALTLPVLAAGPAFAHGGHAEGLAAGLTHPLTGVDHLLAMVAIGLWAAQSGMVRAWASPGAFLGAMAAGIGLGVLLPVPTGAEHAVAASVLGLGLLVAIAVPMPAGAAIGLAALLGLLHGAVHGAEIGGAFALTAGGMLLASAGLLAMGYATGRSAARGATVVRIGGAGIAAVGLLLLAA